MHVSGVKVINIASVILSYNKIQKNDMDTRNQYEYHKIIQFQKNSLSKDFKLFTTINKRIIVKLFNYPGGAGQDGVKVRPRLHYAEYTTKLGSWRS